MVIAILICIFAYFCGSLPFSLWVSKMHGVDLRAVGSGNLGATNVYRALGLRWAVVVFVCDMVKSYVPTVLSMALFPMHPFFHVVVGFVAILGHSLSLWVHFKGGRGAASGMGVLLAISPPIFGIMLAIAVGLILTVRIVSVATLVDCILAPILFYELHYPVAYTVTIGAVCLFIIVRHKADIMRLIQGKENRI